MKIIHIISNHDVTFLYKKLLKQKSAIQTLTACPILIYICVRFSYVCTDINTYLLAWYT
jgi:hypothetical protein